MHGVMKQVLGMWALCMSPEWMPLTECTEHFGVGLYAGERNMVCTSQAMECGQAPMPGWMRENSKGEFRV